MDESATSRRTLYGDVQQALVMPRFLPTLGNPEGKGYEATFIPRNTQEPKATGDYRYCHCSLLLAPRQGNKYTSTLEFSHFASGFACPKKAAVVGTLIKWLLCIHFEYDHPRNAEKIVAMYVDY